MEMNLNEVNEAHVGAVVTLDFFKGDIRKDTKGNILNEHVDSKVYKNLLLTVGKGLMMDRLFGLGAAGAMTRIGVGTNSSAASASNTTLTGSVYKAYDGTPTRAGTVVTCTTTFGTGDANISWNEMGMDNGTTLLNRLAPIGPFNKTSAVSIVATIVFTQN